MKAIKGEGGITFAQDASAKFDAMPRSAMNADCVDYVLSPVAIVAELSRLGGHPYLASEPAKTNAENRPGTTISRRALALDSDMFSEPEPDASAFRLMT